LVRLAHAVKDDDDNVLFRFQSHVGSISTE